MVRGRNVYPRCRRLTSPTSGLIVVFSEVSLCESVRLSTNAATDQIRFVPSTAQSRNQVSRKRRACRADGLIHLRP